MPGPGAATLLESLVEHPRGRAAISPDGSRWLTVGDLLDQARAACLRLRPGRPPTGHEIGAVPVPVTSPVETVVTLLAAQHLGAIPVVGAVPLSGAAAPPGISAGPDQRRHARPDELLDLAARLVRARPAEDLLVDPGGWGGRGPADEPMLVVVTSGSSGAPRAVVRTARSWQASLPGFETLLAGARGPDSIGWAPGSAASTLTLFALWHALATGWPVIAPGRWRGAVSARQGAAAVVVQCVPAVLAEVLDARAAGHLPMLRRAVVAGAPMTGRMRERAARLDVDVVEYYGAAELSFVAADRDGHGLRAFPGAELSVRDGMIWVRSPFLAQGYLDEARGGPLRRDADGWAGVGDRGVLSCDGVLTVRGRGEDTASVAGHTVILDDVEQVLADVPGVGELICLAIPDHRVGQRIIAAVRPAPEGGEDRLVTRLRAAARDRLPPAARPVRYVLRRELPRTTAGKISRAVLAAELAAEPAAEPVPSAGPGGSRTLRA